MYAPTNPIAEEIRAKRMVNSLTDRQTLTDIFSPMSAPPAPAKRALRIPRNMNLGQSIMRIFKANQQKSRPTSSSLTRLEPDCDPC